MKIYIDKFNLEILNDISEIFKEYFVNSNIYITLYTDEGMYRLEEKRAILLEVHDNPIKTYEKYYNKYNKFKWVLIIFFNNIPKNENWILF